MTYASIYKAGLFSGQIALVTGSGSGMGRCAAHEVASLGATVALGHSVSNREELPRGIISA